MATTTNPTTPLADHDRGPFVASEAELAALQRAARALTQSESGSFKLIANDGTEIGLPPTLLRVLRESAEILAADRAVLIDSLGRRVTRHQAAELLGFPMHYLMKLVEAGELPSQKGNGSMLLSLDQVVAYRQEFKRQQREALHDLAQLSQELGLYDLDLNKVKLKRLAEFDDDTESS